MPLQGNRLMTTRKLALLSMFLAYALVVGAIERAFPLDIAIPGVKLGLGNVVVLSALYVFRVRETALLVALKCLLASFFAGTFVSFLYSLSGSVLSFLAMALALRLLGGRLSPIGTSVIGAVFHNLGQVLAACAVLQTPTVFFYMPLLLVSGVVTGVLVGLAVRCTMPFLRRYTKSHPIE